ncbi:Protein-lysine N-methyltransferase EFM2 like protein [Verticillium longisporum]|uniref:Protein-lysine N-methyltransferase EFM2 like protein n=1 Tax=Verticillium longisporum TaxID=100787 RepID=A0A8I2ZL51_VERLO|nr:Protein-lysine N-methyltransferase EFM2 like protein [Verticillium longisporum]
MLEPKDFPQMWQKPSSQDLRSCLQSLEMSPTIWSHTSRQPQIVEDQEATAYVRREMSMYLSSIVKSGLTWIDDEEEKEFIWSEASRRLSERCGRTAMGEITRRTGLLGIAAAALWKVDIVMSDLPEIMANLHHNANVNRSVIESLGGSLNDGALTWGSTSEDEVDQALFGEKNQFKIVLAADPMYDDIHPVLLAGTS